MHTPMHTLPPFYTRTHPHTRQIHQNQLKTTIEGLAPVTTRQFLLPLSVKDYFMSKLSA